MQEFDIYFLGETLPGSDTDAARLGVARLFKVENEAIDRLFSGKPIRIKQAVDVDKAGRYREAFRAVGALVQIVPAGAPAPQAPQRRSQTPSKGSGATTSAPQDAGMTLAEPGATIDPTPPPPAARIATDHLEALPPNTGSLADCHVPRAPQPIPDISHLRLVDD
jgi:hypothetical protein